jgi:hypothetical protein
MFSKKPKVESVHGNPSISDYDTVGPRSGPSSNKKFSSTIKSMRSSLGSSLLSSKPEDNEEGKDENDVEEKDRKAKRKAKLKKRMSFGRNNIEAALLELDKSEDVMEVSHNATQQNQIPLCSVA